MIKILEERNFPVASLRPIASARSAGSKIMFRGQECTIVEASDDAFEGLDIVLGAAENDIAERFAPSIVKAGAVFVDNSSAFRLDPNVPLVIPEINPEDVKWHKGIISNPNCTTIVSLVAINALAKESPIETIIASSYQAVSGAGKGGIDELNNEVKALSEGKHLEPKVFQYQIAYNIIPQIGGEAFEGYTSEEMKMQNEGRKILHLPEMKVSCTCVRVPQRIRRAAHEGEDQRRACQGAHRKRPGLQARRRPQEQGLPHAARHVRSGHRLCRPHS